MNLDNEKVDVKENTVIKLDDSLLSIILYDNTSQKNLIWATNTYSSRGKGYQFDDEITVEKISGKLGQVIKPRIRKSQLEQKTRSKDKAEVFTPSWICNNQNNLVDNAWFNKTDIFNKENGLVWKTIKRKIPFPTIDGKTWEDYVKALRLEIACGEAPYLVSRYDTTTGEVLGVDNRIGMLDRKIRVVNENIDDEDEWYKWIIIAYKSIYGYEWQGDSVLIARENLLYSFIDYYKFKFNKIPTDIQLIEIAKIIAWNIFQMDGLRFVIPNSCHKEKSLYYENLFGEKEEDKECLGCKRNNYKLHNGKYCIIKNWKTNRNMKFVSLLKNKKKVG